MLHKTICRCWSCQSRHKSNKCKCKNQRWLVYRINNALEKKTSFRGYFCHIRVENNIKKMNTTVNSQLMQFIRKFSFFFSWSKLNTSINPSSIVVFKSKLCPFLSFFITKAWLSLLNQYPRVLRFHIVRLL